MKKAIDVFIEIYINAMAQAFNIPVEILKEDIPGNYSLARAMMLLLQELKNEKK